MMLLSMATVARRRGLEYQGRLWMDHNSIVWVLDEEYGDHECLGHVASTAAESEADSRGLAEEHARLLDLWESTDSREALRREWGAR